MAESAEPRDIALMLKADFFAGVFFVDLPGVPLILAMAAVGWYFDLVSPPSIKNFAIDLFVFLDVTD